MFLARRALPVLGNSITASSRILSRSFAFDAESQPQRIKEYEKNRREYKAQVKNLRKQYAAEYAELQKQYDEIRNNKRKANDNAMKLIMEKRKQEKKNNMRHHYEHLCSTQIEKSIRRVNSIHNQLKKEALREKNIRNMLNEHMGYVFDAYKPEEVESRVLKEMQEIVPFDRIYMAPPSIEVNEYLSFADYENVKNIRFDWPAYREKNKELYEKWKKEQKN